MRPILPVLLILVAAGAVFLFVILPQDPAPDLGDDHLSAGEPDEDPEGARGSDAPPMKDASGAAYGRCLDPQNRDPLPCLAIVLEVRDDSSDASTNIGRGMFLVGRIGKFLQSGRRELRLKANGYQTAFRTLDVAPGQETKVEVLLERWRRGRTA